MIDLTIHQLAELRGAILAVIDEGRLVNGKREPWSFYPSGSGWQPIESAPKDETQIVLWWPYWSKKAITGCYYLGRWWAHEALHNEGNDPTHWMPLPAYPNPDWHMDESGDVNLQRTEFCDEVQSRLVKKIVQG